MGTWDDIGRAARDRRSGAAEVAAVAARGLSELQTRREVMRAARKLLKAHPSMAPLWRVLSDALTSSRAGEWPERLAAETSAIGSAAAWVFPRRAVVLTHSSSSSVVTALEVSRKRVRSVICTESRPGGEGKRLAGRLMRAGFVVSVVADSQMAGAAATADVALVGADAVTLDGVVNKVGTSLLALACREARTPLYALAGTSKFIPGVPTAPWFETTALALLDGVVTERGVLNAAATRRIIRRVQIPRELAELFP